MKHPLALLILSRQRMAHALLTLTICIHSGVDGLAAQACLSAYVWSFKIVAEYYQSSPFVKHRMSGRAQLLPLQFPPVHGRRLLATHVL
jgi:hypothetical protein